MWQVFNKNNHDILDKKAFKFFYIPFIYLLKLLPALNFTAFLSGNILTIPFLGFLNLFDFLFVITKLPKPAILTPFFVFLTIVLKIKSTAFFASFF
jgi:hypothetical protein